MDELTTVRARPAPVELPAQPHRDDMQGVPRVAQGTLRPQLVDQLAEAHHLARIQRQQGEEGPRPPGPHWITDPGHLDRQGSEQLETYRWRRHTLAPSLGLPSNDIGAAAWPHQGVTRMFARGKRR